MSDDKLMILNEVGMFGELEIEDPTEIDITDKDLRKKKKKKKKAEDECK